MESSSTGGSSTSGRQLCDTKLHNQGPAGNWDEHILATERQDGTGIDLEVAVFDNKQPGEQVGPIARSFVTLPHEGMQALMRSYGQTMAGSTSQ